MIRNRTTYLQFIVNRILVTSVPEVALWLVHVYYFVPVVGMFYKIDEHLIVRSCSLKLHGQPGTVVLVCHYL